MNKIVDPKYSIEEIQRCIDLLDDLVMNSVELAHLSREQRIAILKAAGEISRPDRDEIRKRKKDRIRLKNSALMIMSGNCEKRRGSVRRVKQPCSAHLKPFYMRIKKKHSSNRN